MRSKNDEISLIRSTMALPDTELLEHILVELNASGKDRGDAGYFVRQRAKNSTTT